MKLLVALAVAVTLTLPAAAQINGYLEIIDGKPVLWVWGTHAERGYAHGFLRGREAKAVFDDYLVDYLCGGSPFVYGYLRNIYVSDYDVDTKYEIEVGAAIDGMTDAGVDLYNATLGRDIDATDILVANAIVELSQRSGVGDFGCSSLSSWGASTTADPVLEGHLVITRLLDWSRHPTLTDNPLLIVHLPSEADEQAWISFTYAGFIGALSAINESGLSSFLNVGNVTTVTGPGPYHPILFSIRNGIEAADYNGGGCAPDDVVAAVSDKARSSGTIIHVTKDAGPASRPIVIECNNQNGVAVRDASDNTLVPGDNLAATNHFRVLYPPVGCPRYAAIADSLTANPEVSIERSWTIMAGAAGQSSNIQAIEYVESEDLILWAVDTYTEPAYLQEPTAFDVGHLFGCPTGVDDVVVRGPALEQNCPNPFNPKTTIRFSLPAASRCRLSIHDTAGREVATLVDAALASGPHELVWNAGDAGGFATASGVYFCRLEAGGAVVTRKLLLLR